MQKINRNPEWNDRPVGTFDLHSCIAGFVWCKFWMNIAHYLEHFNEKPCSLNFVNLLLIFGDIARGWYFLFIFVESDPLTCIVNNLGFSYVNDILWKIFFFYSFLRSDWIQKKNICPRIVLPCFYVIDAYMKGLWVKVQTFQKIENGTLWAESSAGIAWQRPINVCVGMH